MEKEKEMIQEMDLIGCRKLLSQKLNDIITYGHIDKNMFSDEQIKEMKEVDYKDLATQEIQMFNPDFFDDEMEMPPTEIMGLWGEDSNSIGCDLGLACIFFNHNPCVIPQHFMRAKELAKFVMDIAEEDYPEYLI